MSSSTSEGEIKVSQTEVVVTRTEVSGSANDIESVVINDISKISKSAIKSLDGFRTFILRGNVVDLAIGIVIGAAFTAVVNSLVSDVITPLIPTPTGNLATAYISIPWTGGHHLLYGAFINAIFSFLIVAAVLYFFVVQPVSSFMKLYHGKEAAAAPTTHDCPYCYQTVNIKATRCPFCTSPLATSETGTTEETGPVLILPSSLEALSDKLAERIVHKATTALEQGADGTGEASVEKA